MVFIGNNIKKLRVKKGLSQKELSNITGVNYNTLIKIERNNDTNPTISTILSLANGLDSSVELILNDAQNNKQPIINKSELGQVFTSEKVASLMVDMLRKDLKKGSSILDPCIGKNVFFSKLMSTSVPYDLTGIEVDQSLIDKKVKTFFNVKNRKLLISNFLDYSINHKYDAIIMNPPYVRQEDLNGTINTKEKIYKCFIDLGMKLPKKANLYAYFILKALQHLKRNGKIVAIIYDSWFYSDFGEELKKLISRKGTIEEIIHFKEHAFEKVNIGATILSISLSKSKKEYKYISFKSPSELPSRNIYKYIRKLHEQRASFPKSFPSEPLRLSADIFTNLERLSAYNISRGISALINKFFLFEKREFNHLVEIIKDIKTIKNMSVHNEVKYLFNSNEELTNDEYSYLEKIKAIILQNPEQYRSTHRLLKSGRKWFQPKLVQPGNIIFNYYFRDSTDFILNKRLFYSADNFYNTYIQSNLEENFAILNSSFTKYALFRYSKPQGRGLNKLQLNKFRSVRVIDSNMLSSDTRRSLYKLGLELMESSRFNNKHIISKIDTLLMKEYNFKMSQKYGLDDLNKFINYAKNHDYGI